MVFRYLWKKTIILDKKIKVLTKAKKWIFSKGVSSWILSKNRTFSYRCFSQKLCQKRSFFDIYERKESFLDQKIKVWTRAKNGHFPKGLVHGFLDQKIEVLTRAKRWTFIKGVSRWILSKNRTFSYWRFSQKSHQKRSFFDIVERKEWF